MERMYKSEITANLSLVPTTAKPLWMEPVVVRKTTPESSKKTTVPIRTQRRTYGVLAIMRRHPLLFQWLNRKH